MDVPFPFLPDEIFDGIKLLLKIFYFIVFFYFFQNRLSS